MKKPPFLEVKSILKGKYLFGPDKGLNQPKNPPISVLTLPQRYKAVILSKY